MALERSTWKFSGVTFPLTASTSNSMLVDGEPGINAALAYFKAMLIAYLGARWAAECTLAGLTDIASTIVVDAVHYDPQPYLKEQQFKFPLLAVFRTQEGYVDKTGLYGGAQESWSVLWIMPPMTSAQIERLSPFPRLAALVLQNRSQEGGDPSYQSNARVWLQAGIDVMTLKSSTLGLWDTGEGLPFPGVYMTFSVESRQGEVSGAYDAVDRMDTSIDITDPATETSVTDVVIIRNED